MHQRTEHRSIDGKIQYPVSCILRYEGQQFVAEVVNYHYRGACIKIPDEMRSHPQVQDGIFKLDFLVGKIRIQEDLSYRICWNDLQNSGTMGLEFIGKTTQMAARAERFLVNMAHRPRIEAKDPLDPNRSLFLSVCDVSETGLLAQTSLTNKHILPGMRLSKAKLVMPGQESLALDMTIENTRRGSGDDHFLVGLSVVNDRAQYKTALRQYLTEMAPHTQASEAHLNKLANAGLLSKTLKQAITFRAITTETDYVDVLNLRFAGYGKHNKIRPGTTWQQQGEGLKREGLLFGGYLGGQLICSMELRFGDEPLPLRCELLNDGKKVTGIERQRTVEVNKLVIHPKMQGSDIVIGMMQRIHAIVVTKGQYDVLMAATDALAPLYERIGAQKIGIRVPHPFLTDESLNFMLVKREIYHDGLRFNPHAWSTVYQAIHEHFSAIGLAKTRTFTRLEKLTIFASKKLTPYLKRVKKFKTNQSKGNHKGHTSVHQSTHSQQHQRYIDPKWTRHEILATVMYPYIVASSEMIGAQATDAILDEIGIGRDYIKSPVNWLSVAFHDEFLDRFSKFGDPVELSRNAGIRSLEPDIQGVNYYFLKHIMRLHTVFEHLTRVGQKFNRTRTYELVKKKPNGVTIALGTTAKSLLPRRQESCTNWQSSFAALIKLMSKSNGQVRKTTCVYEGHQSCTYELEWENNANRAPLLYAMGCIGMTMAGYQLASMITPERSAKFAVAAFSCLIFTNLASVINLWRQSKRFKSASREFEVFQQDAGEKYSELQESKHRVDEMYREARILEQTSRDIQRNEVLHGILDTTLKAACQNFRFDRAFVMLRNDSNTTLQTAAISGVEEHASILWKFAVDIKTRRENAVFLSSVFHTGNPIVINDIEAHLFQLNEASRELLLKFDSQGFVIVQIPGRAGGWGVLVADQQAKHRALGKRDIKVLERLGQQLGVALDKRADFEREERLRNHFQKYVPAAVVAESLGRDAPVLGGQMREIIAMFVDIRGFTTLAASLTPTATVNLLNQFFSILEPTISEFGGTVDKYLGDGALVTWGSSGTGSCDTKDAIRAALTLLERVDQFNETHRGSGQPEIQIGIGLNKGPAITGNIGSTNRVEFTSIGATVNLAARLEGQCKDLQCAIVASSTMQVNDNSGWQQIDDVSIRGLTDLQSVWIYRKTKQQRLHLIERTVA